MRPALLLAALALAVAGCDQVGTQNITFWDILFSMVFFGFWFLFVWIVIALFTDVIRRRDLSGVWKAIWIFVLILFPIVGALIYVATRPAVTEQEMASMGMGPSAAPSPAPAAGVSVADELEKLERLKASGGITEAEYEMLKQQTIHARA